MSELQGYATFPGIGQIESVAVSLTVGISPSTAVVTMLPQVGDIAPYGNLALTFGGGGIILIDCKADYGRLQVDRSGWIWQISILDRRWKWKFGNIGGQWNLRKPDNTIKEGTEKTPQELARLCLEAMDEDVGSWYVGDLPNDSHPRVMWDCDVPAEALAKLCESLGCFVVPDFHRRGGRICVAGQGEYLPTEGVESVSVTLDPPETPSTIIVVCGQDKFEHDFELEPVGEENDAYGTIKKIDDLSYKPADGWDSIDPEDFESIGDANGQKAMECAKKSVWKWFRIKIPDWGITIPGWLEQIFSLDCIQLEDRRVDVSVDKDCREVVGYGTVTTTDKTRRKPAVIHGTFYDDENGLNTTAVIDPDDPEDGKYQNDFSIDASRRMVRFSKPIYKKKAGYELLDMGVDPPEIKLRTACTLLSQEKREPVRTYQWQDTGAPYETEPLVVRHDEIVLGHTPDVPEGVNLSAVQQELQYYMDAEFAKIDADIPQQATFMGWINAQLDGAIRQITYEVDKSGARTTISRNTEDIDWVAPYEQRRAAERIKAATRKAQVAEVFNSSADDRSADVYNIA
jgi:hypothetical protein